MEDLFQFTVQIALEEADPEELDHLTRQLADELRQHEVESVALVQAGQAPKGSKAAEAVTLGALAVAVLPTLLPKVVEFCQAWAQRSQGRLVKFKGRVGAQEIEFEGSAQDLQHLLTMLASPPAATNPSA